MHWSSKILLAFGLVGIPAYGQYQCTAGVINPSAANNTIACTQHANAGVNSDITSLTALSAAAAASQPTVDITGAWYTGGSATTNWGTLTIAPAGNTFTGLSTNGVGLLMGNPNGGTGNFIELHSYNGGSVYSVSYTGGMTSSGSITASASISSKSNSANLIYTQNQSTSTSGACVSSGVVEWIGTYYNGSSSATDTFSATPSCVAGTNGAETLTFANAGSTGQFTLAVTGEIAPNQPLTSVGCATSGTVQFAEPEAGVSDKRVKAYANACIGAASYTFPVAFTNTPAIVTTNEVSSSVVTALSTTAMTVTGATTTGFIVIEGW